MSPEAVYENRLESLSLLSGVMCRQKYTANTYSGDVCATDRTRSSELYMFGQVSGNLRKLSCVAGAGVSNAYFSQGSVTHRFWLFRPKLTLLYPLTARLRLSYGFEVSQHISGIARTSTVAVRINSMEVSAGNPELRPNSRTEHTLRLAYDAPRLAAALRVFYRQNDNCNMAKYVRRTDSGGNTTFVYTQTNQDGCDMLAVAGNLRCDLVPGKLTLGCAGGVYRFFNIGDDYRHFYTAFSGSVSLTAHLGWLSLSAYADNGWHWMEGETRGHNGSSVYLSATCRAGRLALSLYWRQPLQGNAMTHKAETMSRYVGKTQEMRSRDFSNMVSLSVSWTLQKGRKYRNGERKISHSDTDSGIVR